MDKKIDCIKEIVIDILIKLLESNKDENIRCDVATRLGEIDPGNETAISTLVNLLKSTEDQTIRQEATVSLEQVGTGNDKMLATVVKMLLSTSDKEAAAGFPYPYRYKNLHRRSRCPYDALEYDPCDKNVIATLIQIIESTEDEYNCHEGNNISEPIDSEKKRAICILVKLLETRQNSIISPENLPIILFIAAKCILKIESDNEVALSTLINLLELDNAESRGISIEDSVSIKAAEYLGEIDPNNEKAISALIKKAFFLKGLRRASSARQSLKKIGTGNKIAISALETILESTDKEYIVRETAELLAEINPDKRIAISSLVSLIESTDYPSNLLIAAQSLWRINPGNKAAITALLKIIEYEDENLLTTVEDMPWDFAETLEGMIFGSALGQYATSGLDEYATSGLALLLESTDDKNILKEFIIKGLTMESQEKNAIYSLFSQLCFSLASFEGHRHPSDTAKSLWKIILS